jgi:hypothetical protein
LLKNCVVIWPHSSCVAPPLFMMYRIWFYTDCLVLHKNDVDIPLTTWRRATSLCCRICQQQNIDIKSQLLLLLFNSASILATQEHHFSLVYLFSFQDNIWQVWLASFGLFAWSGVFVATARLVMFYSLQLLE